MKTLHTTPGRPEPLGATWDGHGTNFALYSEGATAVLLCLFDADGHETQIPLRHRTEFVWHVYVEWVAVGTRYGFRVDGPWDPEKGLRFNAHNVLLDPYAKALLATEDWDRGAFSYDTSAPEKDLVKATNDQRGAPLGLVIDEAFEWGDDAPPNVPLRRTVIYEAHVKGLTMRHPDVPADLRGTYLGLASDPVVRHLRELGITAVELLPVQGFVDDAFLKARGLRNYWGYNSIAFFAPDVRYRSGSDPGAEVRQCKRMVKALHAAGIEVILDVVYNHTAEGNHLGPTLSFRGIDNTTYYRLVADAPRYYFDYTGTGNSINVLHPQALRLIMDSLRYWVLEMHVDGFRFDLASTLARGLYDVDQLSSFFTIIHQDPVINRVKLIAEPWDLGNGGYQVGRFPVRWSEWNGQYRDTLRAFWRGDGGRAADVGFRLTGSSDLYQEGGRSPSASVNFITAHDGFTLADLVSYDQKHNEANGESNQDGSDHNLSWNGGVEGPTTDPNVLATRKKQSRNLLATLFLSHGVPMLSAGDEMGRTQGGNNNAYCQDNEISWVDWALDGERTRLLDFTRRAIRLRRAHPLLERASFFGGRVIRGVGARDIAWFRHDGASMSDEDWANAGTRSLGVFMAGSSLDSTDEEGNPQFDDDLLLIFNASAADLEFTVPAFVEQGQALAWSAFLDTAVDAPSEQVDAGGCTTVRARSLKAFSRRALGPGGLQAAYGAPVSTYRLQLPGLGFRGASQISDYLQALGLGGVYASPYLRAERGSSHGYNVVDHSTLAPEFGTEGEYRAWTDDLKSRGLRHVMDFVPNHVGIGTGENRWFQDVLENGANSEFADFFDIDWHPPPRGLRDKVLLPVLGRQFGQEVNDGNVGVRRDGGTFSVTYYERRYPASLASYAQVLARALEGAERVATDPERQELESILASLRRFPHKTTSAAGRAEWTREKNVLQRWLSRLTSESPWVRDRLDAAVRAIATNPEWLENFLNAQHFRLSYWKVATEEINYRRFFDVNELAAIRMEDPRVFAAAHALVLDLIREGRVTGLRLDHTDGLYDPEGYLRALQASAREALREGSVPNAPPIYVVAEKVLETGEELPQGWALSGTTGYDFLAVANGLWVDPGAEESLTQLYADFAESPTTFSNVVHQSKRDVMEESFSSEIHVLAQALKRIADKSRDARDFTLPSLTRLIKETMAAFPVYRTYLKPTGIRQAHDEENVRAAIRVAKEQNPRFEGTLFEFLQDILLLRTGGEEGARFAMKFQQISGPIMAKGVEDTAHYRYNRLVSLNEVGCNASGFGQSVATFHAHNAEILARWPLSMTTTTTHDTKRSEDVRSRLSVLSELPEAWSRFVRELDAVARAPGAAPLRVSGADAYLFYQTVVGIFPMAGIGTDEVPPLADRLVSYLRKATREAKLATSWATPNVAYEESLESFVRATLASPACLPLIQSFVAKVATVGATNSLAQLALRLGSPGVPDLYQGCELWDLSLVDPDNRRLVDYDVRRRLLSGLRASAVGTPQLCRELLDTYTDGRLKMYVTWLGLTLRREKAALFLEGSYEPVLGTARVVAFERRLGSERVVCIAPRLVHALTSAERPWPLADAWGKDALPLSRAGSFRDLFTGREESGSELRLSEVLNDFPVAWLVAS